MMDALWSVKRLGELGEFRNGVNYDKDSFGEGVKVLGVSDFKDYTKPRYSDLEQIRPEGVVTSRNILREGDIVFVRSNGNRELIGRSLFIEQPPEQITHSAFTIRLRFTSQAVHPKFYAYLFRTRLIRQALSAAGGGTNISNLNQDILGNLAVPIPPLNTQRRIADILSAYDDLIENCERRIRVLDEMARALYREWFVLFRYPGHEKTPLVESALGSIPRGWRLCNLLSVSDGPDGVQTGPFGSQLHQEEYSNDGVPVVMPKDLRGYRIDDTDIARVPGAVAERVVRHRMKPEDIVYGRRGDIGRRGFVMKAQTGIVCGTGCLRVRPCPTLIDGWYLFNYLGRDDVVAMIAGRAQGVTMPNLNTKLLATVPILVPPRNLQDEFRLRSFPLAEARELLFSEVRNLRKTRDLLLPRLLSGQLSVDEAP